MMRVLELNARQNKAVMAGHSRLKDGVASLAYVPAIHALPSGAKNVDARDKPGHDDVDRLVT
ncbi:MAG: hypothetical protein HOQ20_22555 [Bradyrhizobium sp.]|nr:hypothetical protein [Bradyrhizobium sp.]